MEPKNNQTNNYNSIINNQTYDIWKSINYTIHSLVYINTHRHTQHIHTRNMRLCANKKL